MKPNADNGGKYRILSEINMIPFIDVSLVLLIIFMIMAPLLMKAQIKLNLPDSKAVESLTPDDKTIDIQIQAGGQVFLDGRPVSDDDLEDALKARIRNPATQGAVIEADKGVPFQRVVLAMSAVKKLGVTKMAVCVLEERTRKPGTHR